MNNIINKISKEILNDSEVGILCKTEKDANELLKQLDKLGYKWFSKNSLINTNYFYNYGCDGIIYDIYDNKTVCHSSTYSHYDYIFKTTPKTNKTKSIKHIINGTTTIVILEDGRKGIAKLHPSDEFNEFVGFEIAYKRAMGIYDFNNENYTVNEEEFWKDFINSKIAIILESDDEAREFQKMCEDKNLDTYGNNNYFLNKLHNNYNDSIGFSCGIIKNNRLGFASIVFYKNRGLKIVKFKDVFKTNNISVSKELSDYTNEELLKELKIRLNK